MTTDPTVHSISAPINVSLPSNVLLKINGVIIHDDFAANSPGFMAINVSCSRGGLLMTDQAGTPYPGSGTNSISLRNVTLAQVNAAFASLAYILPTPMGIDTIHLDIWNQAGQEYGTNISLVMPAGNPTQIPVPPPITLPPPPPVVVPPAPPPVIIPSDPNGIVARRVVDVLSVFGTNTFSNGQDNPDKSGNHASAEAHIAGFKYICGDSGIGLLCREYAGNAAAQTEFCSTISKAVPGLKWNICVSYLSSVADVIQMAKNSAASGKWLKMVEGVNEPNNTEGFGFGNTLPKDCLATQQQLYNAVHPLGIHVMSPSVADDTGSPTFILDYYQSQDILNGIILASDYYNAHDYPNSGAPNKELQARTQGISQVYGGKRGGITEFHAALYNNQQTKDDENLAALNTLIALVSGVVDFRINALIHYCMYDYVGFGVPVGLFKNFDPTQPRPVATAMRALFQLTGDKGPNKFSFAPGKTDITVTGLPAGFNGHSGGRVVILQNSLGQNFILIWNEQDNLNLGVSSPITVKFNAGPRPKIVDYSLTNPITDHPKPIQALLNTDTVHMDLTTEMRVLQV